MRNVDLYSEWCSSVGISELPHADERGLFPWGKLDCILPFLRAYYPSNAEERPEWEPETWSWLDKGWTRLLRADQVLTWIAWLYPPEKKDGEFLKQVRRALLVWLIPVAEPLVARNRILDRRVEAIRIELGDKGLEWSRRADRFPRVMRDWIEGFDPVHTPENERAGLTRYLGEGWRISDKGALQKDASATNWGPSTSRIPQRLHDGPRRLMLGASLQARAVPLEDSQLPNDRIDSEGWNPPGQNLRVVFSAWGGLTHEDAIVLSCSAVAKLTRLDILERRILVPSVAGFVSVASPGRLEPGFSLARAFIDLYALGWRRHHARELGPLQEDGWVEIALPEAVVPWEAELLDVQRRMLRTRWWREKITYRLKRRAALGIGDKLSTRHGIKGVVSKFLEDEQMPKIGEEPAEIILSPLGVIRRGAMGQFREASASSGSAGLPRSGRIFVMRQEQDAVPRCRVLGGERTHGRGQRYGEMEFWALMAHGAADIARELLSVKRSTAPWMQWEMKVQDGGHRVLSTRAINRFLRIFGARVESGQLVLPELENGQLIVRHDPNVYSIPARTQADFHDCLDLLRNAEWFVAQSGLCALDLRKNPVRLILKGHGQNKLTAVFETVYVLPPWLCPASKGRLNELTLAYRSTIYALVHGWDPRRKRSLSDAVKNCVSLMLDETLGVGAFLRREVLGRRLTRSARAVIIPRPDLCIDQIAIPKRVAQALFDGLASASKELVLVNRNPTLHRRGLVALRPVIDESDQPVFGLPLGLLKVLGADFDGDQVNVVSLETQPALEAAKNMLPGSAGLRADPFRRTASAFPLLRELSVHDKEWHLASDIKLSQQDWCSAHAFLVQEQVAGIKDGWDLTVTHRESEKNQVLWNGLEEQDWIRPRAQEEMDRVYDTVRKKGQLGGILRRQLYRLQFADEASFWRSVEALQEVTERIVQSALSVKVGAGITAFDAKAFFADPKANQASLNELDPTLDPARVYDVLGGFEDPSGLLAWLARPYEETLIDLLTRSSHTQAPGKTGRDPRINWFLS